MIIHILFCGPINHFFGSQKWLGTGRCNVDKKLYLTNRQLSKARINNIRDSEKLLLYDSNLNSINQMLFVTYYKEHVF